MSDCCLTQTQLFFSYNMATFCLRPSPKVTWCEDEEGLDLDEQHYLWIKIQSVGLVSEGVEYVSHTTDPEDLETILVLSKLAQ